MTSILHCAVVYSQLLLQHHFMYLLVLTYKVDDPDRISEDCLVRKSTEFWRLKMKQMVQWWTCKSTIIFMILTSTAICQQFTDCGGQLKSSYGIIRSPGYPSNYPNYADCHWIITANGGQVIDLRFYRIDVEGNNASCNDAIHVYDGESTNSMRLVTLCGSKSQSEVSDLKLRSTGNKLHIFFSSDYDGVRPGFIATYWTQACAPYTYGRDTCNQQCNCARDNSIGCDTVSGNCLCKPGWSSTTCSTTVCKENNCTYLCSVATTSPWREQCTCPAWMRSVPNSNGQSCVNLYDCGSNISAFSGKLASPGYSNGYTNDINCQWRISTTAGNVIAFRFNDIDLENNTSCNYDSVELFQDLTSGSQSLGKFCGNTIPGIVYSQSNNLRIVFKTDGSVVAKGFFADFYSLAPSASTCTPITLTGTSGSFTSPNYPNNYVDNTFKCWIIYGSTISLRFSYYDLENCGSCGYLQFFRTDGSVTKRGFYATYTTAASCGGELTASSGTITSPGYPIQYVNNLLCAWTIEGRNLQTISFRITDIAMESPTGCIYDYVDVYDGTTTNNPKVLHTCDNRSLTVRSTGSVMYVIFRTDGSVTNRGFSATYEILNECAQWTYGSGCTTPCPCIRSNALSCNSQTGQCICKSGWTGSDCSQVSDPCLSNPCPAGLLCFKQGLSFTCLSGLISACNSIITSTYGYISSPNYPRNYYDKTSCTWTISGPPNAIVTLNFMAFDLEVESKCSYDSLQVFDGANSRLLGKYCGSGISTVLRSTTNIMRLVFTTDNSVTSKGFLASFNVHSCASFTYGRTCESTCNCVQANTDSFDNINGICFCKAGFTGARCSEDVDECQAQSTLALCPSNSLCQNTVGSFNCECKPGFVMNSLRQCQVNNNCKKLTSCSHSCYINSAGKDQCTCPDNMILGSNKLNCAVPFYPYGENASDILMNSSHKESAIENYYSKVTFGGATPYGTSMWREAYVLHNGVISFTSPAISREPNFNLILTLNPNIIAPFWAKTIPSKGSVFHHLYEKCDDQIFKNPSTSPISPTKTSVMERAARDVKQFFNLSEFDVSRVLVTTWQDVHPESETNNESASFQSIYISGNRKIGIVNTDQFSDEETAYVIFIYQQDQIRWQQKEDRAIKVGIVRSGLITDIGTSFDPITTLSRVNGEKTGLPGVWAYEVSRFRSSEIRCQRYTCKHSPLLTNQKYKSDVEQLYRCPCTLNLLDRGWEEVRRTSDTICYALSSVVKRRILQNNFRNRLCCYRWSFSNYINQQQYEESRRQASNIHNSPDAGHVLVADPWSDSNNYLSALENIDAHNWCCKESNSAMCGRFHTISPDAQCTYMIPFIPASVFGDPHFITLDNFTYTMNGWGEYVMMNARTDRAESSNGTKLNATVFTAFAAKEDRYPSFQVKLAANRTCVTLIIHLEVRSLVINIEVDRSLHSLTKGLLGNFNERSSDDFELPDGTILPSNMTEKDILEKIAASYKVTTNNSVFIYETGKTTSDYQHPEFVPLFTERINQSSLNEAIQICGTTSAECLYDYTVTGDAIVALATKNAKIQAVTYRNFLANTPPTIQIISLNTMVNGRWLVQDGVKNVLQLLATDADNDNITYINVYNSTSVTVLANGTVEFLVTSSNPVKLGFQARDAKGAFSVILNILISVCPSCNGHGMCDPNSTIETEYLNGAFQILRCLCYPAYTGLYCNSELDGCESKPCSKGQNCTDLTAAQQGNSSIGYACGPCPAGFINVNRTCIDINECSNTSLCHQMCVNTEGSYKCQCYEGYNISVRDNKRCTNFTCSYCNMNKTLSCNSTFETCTCKPGWGGQYCNINLNACTRNSCRDGLLCVERDNGFDCLCHNSAQPSASGTCEDCNRTITNSGGVIMSTNYPLNYPNDAHCTWTILSNQTGAIVTLNITEYDVEGCPYDYLTIYDGNSSRASQIGQFCNSAPGLITSSGGALHLVFISDDSTGGKGFIGTYTVQTKCKLKNCSHSCEVISTNPRIEQCVCPEWSRLDPNNSSRCVEINACNTTITSSSGYIVSPGYPNLYPSNTTCYWIISTSSTKQILLSFSDLKIEESTNCAYDYIKVLDGNSLQSQSLGQFCGNNLPVSLRSRGSYMYILFKSDDSIAGRGFNAQFTSVQASSNVLQLN
ncbi:hypothetical protein Btru_045434 [Bulinus truncatus]|nr:hypothetical protein Btru_045434 [Bulinus truncatus]